MASSRAGPMPGTWSRHFLKSATPALCSCIPGPWLGRPATRRTRFPLKSAGLLKELSGLTAMTHGQFCTSPPIAFTGTDSLGLCARERKPGPKAATVGMPATSWK